MRKVIALVLCMLMLLAIFAGCAKSEPAAEESKAPAASKAPEASKEPEVVGTPVGNGTLTLTDDPVELTFWLPVNDTENAEEMATNAWDELIADFQAKYPQVTISAEGVGSNSAERLALLNVAAAADNFPELFVSTDASIISWSQSGVIAEYKDYLSDDYFAAYQPGSVENANGLAGEGVVYSTPTQRECEGWLMNTELFNQCDLEIPQTFDELISAIEVFKANGINPIAHGGADTWAIWGYHGIIDQYGVDPEQAAKLEAGEITVKESGYYGAFKRIAELAQAGAYAADVATTLNDTAAAQYMPGGAAVWQIYDSWRHNMMKQYDADPEAYAEYYAPLQNSIFQFGFEFDDDEVADGEVFGLKMCNWGVYVGDCVNDDPQKLAAAIAFLEFMVSEEEYYRWSELSISIPLAYTSESDYDYSMWGLEQSYIEAYAAEGTFSREPQNFFNVTNVDTYRNCVTGLICGTLTPDEAVVELENWQTTAMEG